MFFSYSIFAQHLTAKNPASQRYDVIERDLAPPNVERDHVELALPRAINHRSPFCASLENLKSNSSLCPCVFAEVHQYNLRTGNYWKGLFYCKNRLNSSTGFLTAST